jgi:Transglycosylase SLT domain
LGLVSELSEEGKMFLDYLKKWFWIVFLLPIVMPGDHPGNNSSSDSSFVMEKWQEEQSPSILFLDDPMQGSLWLLAETIAFEHGLSPKLIKSIILTESNGDPQKISPKGAKGLMQLMPVVIQHYNVLDPYDPVANIRGGVQYLGSLLKEFSGDLHLALAAYNAGPGAVRKYRGIPPFPETEAFVRKVSGMFHSAVGDAAGPHPPLPRMAQKDSGERFPPNLLVSGTPRSLGLFVKRITADPVVQDQ